MTAKEFISISGNYSIISYGYGLAYHVTDRVTGKSIFVQDDSATQLREDTKGFCDDSVMRDYFDALA